MTEEIAKETSRATRRGRAGPRSVLEPEGMGERMAR